MTRVFRGASGGGRHRASRRCRATRCGHYGIAQPQRTRATDSFELADLVEKPSAAEAPSNLAIAARYVFRPRSSTRSTRRSPGKGGEIQLTDAIRPLIQRRRQSLRRPPRRRRSAASTSATSTRTSARSSNLRWPIRSMAPALRAFVERLLRCIIIRKRAYARAGLVGNPSDGYHGKTISLSVRNFWAEVVLYEWDTVEIVLAEDDRARLQFSVHDLARDVNAARLLRRHPADQGDHQTLRRVLRSPGLPLHDRNFSVRYQHQHPAPGGAGRIQRDHRGDAALPDGVLRGRRSRWRRSPRFVLSVEREELRHRGRAARSRDPGLRRPGLHGLRSQAASGSVDGLQVLSLRTARSGAAAAALSGLPRRAQRTDRGVSQRHPRALRPRRARKSSTAMRTLPRWRPRPRRRFSRATPTAWRG